MSRGGSLCGYSRSRRVGNCCKSKNGCGRPVEEPGCQERFEKELDRSFIKYDICTQNDS